MTKVSERFEVSGSYLARVCERLNVPRPVRGHWAKVAVGKAAPQPALPDALPGDQLTWSAVGEIPPQRKVAPVARQQQRASVRIPRNSTHGIIRNAKVHFVSGRPVDEGTYLKPNKKLLVDVTASAASLDTALGLANDFFNALESVGHRVLLAASDSQLRRASIEERETYSAPRSYYDRSSLWSPQRPTVVFIGNVAIGLTVVEMSEQVLLRYVGGKYIRDADYVAPRRSRFNVDHSWTTTRELPSGRFRIVAYSPYSRVDWSKTWQDGRRTSLRSMIRFIVREIEEAAANLMPLLEEADRKAEIAHREWLEVQERRRREEDSRMVEQSIKDSRVHLADVSQQWAHVVSVEQFFVGVEQRAAELPDDDKRQIRERLELARAFMGSMDPLDFFKSWRTPSERYIPKYEV